MTISKLLVVSVLLLSFFSFGQNFTHKKKLNNLKKGWYEIALDHEVYDHASKDLGDLRILGINAKGDTIEAPYILEMYENMDEINEITCKPYNVSSNGKGYYATFKLPVKQFISEIDLLFANINYDWEVDVEGSDTEGNWLSITKNQRIINIDNEQMEFDHSKINFNPTNFKYYRIFIKSTTETPKIESITVQTNSSLPKRLPLIPITPTFKTVNKNNLTYLEVTLNHPVPVHSLQVNFKNDYDFYRPATILYGNLDSTKTEDGYAEHFENETSAIFNSQDNSPISLHTTICNRFVICIENGDNEPLEIKKITLNTLNYKLIARITKEGNYSLYYGNKDLVTPQYDIHLFKENIPTNIEKITLSEEETLVPVTEPEKKPISKVWLWVMMFGLIGMMIFFSVRMLKK